MIGGIPIPIRVQDEGVDGIGLLGRAGVRHQLRVTVGRALGGHGGLGLVVGEAGLGKTAVLADVAEHAVGRGFEVWWAGCWEGAGAPPFWPWVQILRKGEAARGPAGQVGDFGAVADAFGPTDGPLSGRDGRSVGGDPRERFSFFDSVASNVVDAARSRPLLVVVDDLQWADVPSLLLFKFLAGRLKTDRVMLLGAFRDDEVGADQIRGALLADLRVDADVVALPGLDVVEVGQLMTSMAGAAPPADLVVEVLRRTGGNPFFVREVTQLLLSRGVLDEKTGAVGIPDGVRHVVRHRLARLPQGLVKILSAAAAVGAEVDGDLLSRVCGIEAGELAEQLPRAVAARVLLPPEGPVGPWRFAHDLFRETLYDDLTSHERANLHFRVATSLKAASSEGRRVRSAELADHFLLAASGDPASNAPLAEQAARFGMLAARESIDRLAYEDAVGHVRRQLNQLGSAGLLTAPVRLRLLLSEADALRCAGDLVSARIDYREALDLADGSPLPGDFAEVALGVHALGTESGTSRADCVDLLEEALDRLGDDAGQVTARVLAALSRELFLIGPAEHARSAVLSAEAVTVARRSGDDSALSLALLARHDSLWQPGLAGPRKVVAEEMEGVARRSGDRAFEAEARLLRALAGLELGEASALSDIDEFDRMAAALHQPRFDYLMVTRRAAAATMIGQFARAEQLIIEAGRLARRTGEPDAWNVQSRLWWRLRSVQGRRLDAKVRGREMPNFALKFWYDLQQGLILLEQGHRSDGLRLIRSALQTRPADLTFPYVLAAQWAELGEGAIAADEPTECRRYYEELKPYVGTTVVTAAVVSFDGAVDHHLGLLAAALGRVDEAIGHLESAALIHERLTAWPWLAASRCELAQLLAARNAPGDAVRAAGLLAEVRQAAIDFELTGLQHRAEHIGSPRSNVYSKDGDSWLIRYADREIRLRDSKGLRDIAALLAASGRPVPALTLVRGVEDAANEFGADPVLDSTAQRQYRRRLVQLGEDIDEARALADLSRLSALTGERDFLVRELSAAFGLGHRDRRLGDDRERARKAVSGRIKEALVRINAVNPLLAEHFTKFIHTGYLCSYEPEPLMSWHRGDDAGGVPEGRQI